MSQDRYKTRSFQQLYEVMLRAATDVSSELYYNGKPHRGAGHRAAFWDGYAGLTKTANVIPGTASAVCFAAGKMFAKRHPEIAFEDAVWTPGVTRQGQADRHKPLKQHLFQQAGVPCVQHRATAPSFWCAKHPMENIGM